MCGVTSLQTPSRSILYNMQFNNYHKPFCTEFDGLSGGYLTFFQSENGEPAIGTMVDALKLQDGC